VRLWLVRKMWWYLLPLLSLPVAYVLLLLLIRRASPAPQLGVQDGGRLRPCPGKPNCVCSQADDAAHRVEPLPFTGPPEQAWQKLRTVVDGLPRVHVVEVTDAYLRIEATTLFWRFVDDVEFVLDATAGVIHCRSASRLGHSDLGVNRHRVETIRAAFVAP
jgi:uncharacterized protein (DUF1499 family)